MLDAVYGSLHVQAEGCRHGRGPLGARRPSGGSGGHPTIVPPDNNENSQPAQPDQEADPRDPLETGEVEHERDENGHWDRPRYDTRGEEPGRQDHPAQEQPDGQADEDYFGTDSTLQPRQQFDHLLSVGRWVDHLVLHQLNAVKNGRRKDPDQDEGRPDKGEERPLPVQQVGDAKHSGNEENERQQAEDDGR